MEKREKQNENETRNKSRRVGQVNRLLREERKKQNKRGKKTCLYTNFIVTHNVTMTHVLTLSSSISQSWKLMETDRMISNQLSANS